MNRAREAYTRCKEVFGVAWAAIGLFVVFSILKKWLVAQYAL